MRRGLLTPVLQQKGIKSLNHDIKAEQRNEDSFQNYFTKYLAFLVGQSDSRKMRTFAYEIMMILLI